MKKLVIFTLSISLIGWGTNNWLKTNASQENLILKGTDGRLLSGSSYWATSNLREWLNSSDIQVEYTSNPPSNELTNGKGYDKEAGFLNEFTEEELSQIALTEHRVPLSHSDQIVKDGGTKAIGHFNIVGPTFLSNFDWAAFTFKPFFYQAQKDKVFLLNPEEMYWYLTQRGYPYERTLTPEAAKKHNTSTNPKKWWVVGSFEHSATDYVSATQGDLIGYQNLPINNFGVVPAIHLKPDSFVSGGQPVSQFKIGDEVVFGRYLSAPITWQIINITEEGYPLLLAKHILDLKIYDAKGDYSKATSEVLNFKDNPADLSIAQDIQFQPTFGGKDKAIPKVTVVDDQKLYQRQNEPFTLTLNISDDDSGIKWIQLPNGQKTTTTTINYLFTENKDYIFKVMDQAGNVLDFVVPVNNINESSEISILPNTTDWTKNNVTVEIRSLAEVSQTKDQLTLTNINGYWAGSKLKNYISYANQTFKITGNLRLLNHKPGAEQHRIAIGFYFDKIGKNNYSYAIHGEWGAKEYISGADLIRKQEMPFEITMSIADNYYRGLEPVISIGKVSGYPETCIEVEVSDVKYELLTDSDIKIADIELPSGEMIKTEQFEDSISTEGVHSWTYRVTDNRGVTFEKTITTKIDKTKPTLTITPDAQNDHTYEQTYHLSGFDELSGVKKIDYKLTGATNQEWTTFEGDEATVTVSKAGRTVLTARVEDQAGNQYETTLPIQIDQEIEIEDSELKAIILESLGIREDQLFRSELEKLTELEVSNRKIQSLAGLEYATNLTTLYLNQNEITNLEPLKGLTKLEQLDLSQNPIEELDPITTLVRLQTLKLNEVRVDDWSPLSDLTEIRELHLEQNQIEDLEFAKPFKKIRTLNLANNQIQSIEELTNLTTLTTLNLSNNQIQDLSPLQDLPVQIQASDQAITYETRAANDLSFENPLKNKDGSYAYIEFDDDRVTLNQDYSRFKIVYSFLNEMPIEVSFKGSDQFEGTITLHLMSDLTQIPQDLTISGEVKPIVLNFEVPTELPILINVNQETPVIAPDFFIQNHSLVPLEISLADSELISDTLTLVPLNQYSKEEWLLLNREGSKQLGIGLKSPQSGLIDTSKSGEQVLGVLAPKDRLNFDFQVHHGLAFETNHQFKLKLKLILGLRP